MDISILIDALGYIKPEIAISSALMILVLLDLIFHKDKKIIPYVALISVVVTAFFVIEQFSMEGTVFKLGSSVAGMVTVDSFAAFFKMIVLLASAAIVFFSFNSDEVQKTVDRIGEYYALIFGMILGMFFLVSSSDFILIYLSLELMSLSSYVLAGFTKLRERNSEAALKYMIYGAISSGIMLFGISIVYGITGTTNLYEINNLIQSPDINVFTLALALLMIFTGIGYKISAAPFHYWTPDVYEGAPITITAYLSVASKAAGFALLIRLIKTSFVSFVDAEGTWQLINIFDWQMLLVIISVLTMTLGNFSALWQDNLKRMLAYSSIAHAGYMLLGVLVFSNTGVTAVMLYFIVYLIMNLGAFFIVMLIANKTGSEDINDYDGMGYTSPFLGVTLGIFLVSLVGLPPTAGFIGKVYLFIALLDAKMVAVAVIAVLNSVVSLYYYIRVLKHMFLVKPNEDTPAVSTSIFSTIIILVFAVPTILFGIYFTPIADWAKNAAKIFGI